MKPADLIAYIEKLPVGDGDSYGEPYRLLKYQKSFLRGSFKEGVIRAGFTLGRGGGKTGLASALALAALLPDSPLHRNGFEVAMVASSFPQACICGRSVKTSLELMGKSFGRTGEYRVLDSQNIFEITNLTTHSRFKVYGSDSKRAHGLRPNLLLLDEPAQWETGGEKLAAALRTALGKRKGAKMLAFGTRPDSEVHWFERMLVEKDPAVFSMIFATERKSDPFNERNWHKANPALAEGFPDIEILRAEARLARTDDNELASFRALRLNQGTADTARQYLIEPGDWKEAEVVELPPAKGKYSLGLDLGGVGAFTAASAYWPESGRLDGFQACGGNPVLSERAKADRVPGTYEKMEQRGELVVMGGKVVPIDDFLKECVLRWGPPGAIACDRWREGELIDAVNEAKLRLPMPSWRGQGWKDGSVDIRAFKTELLEGRVHAPQSLAMRAAFAEARILVDPAGNEKLAKGSEAGRRQKGRDDLCNAILMAVAEGSRIRPKVRTRKRRYAVV